MNKSKNQWLISSKFFYLKYAFTLDPMEMNTLYLLDKNAIEFLVQKYINSLCIWIMCRLLGTRPSPCSTWVYGMNGRTTRSSVTGSVMTRSEYIYFYISQVLSERGMLWCTNRFVENNIFIQDFLANASSEMLRWP